MARVLTVLLILAGVALVPSIASAATYYVGVTSCSDAYTTTQAQNPATPYCTIGHAMGTASFNGIAVNPGDTVVVLNGTYVEPMVQVLNSGTAALPITLMAQNKWGAILSSTSSCNPAISILASYFNITGIRFSVDATNVTCGIYSSSNGAIRYWNSLNPTAGAPSSGTVGGIVDSVYVDFNAGRNIGIKSGCDNWIIQNSTINASIILFNSNNNIIRNNISFSGNATNDFTQIETKGGVRNLQVYDNIVNITAANGVGINLGGQSSCCWFDANTHIENYNSVAYNNVVTNQSGGNPVCAMYIGGGTDDAFLNNVVTGGGQLCTVSGSTAGTPPQPVANNPTWKDNIFYGNGNAATSSFFGWTGFQSGTVTIDHNDFFNYTGLPTQTNGITTDPLFVNPASDWHLQSGSPAIGTGVATSFTAFGGGTIDVSHDYTGASRTIPWDMGIYCKNCTTSFTGIVGSWALADLSGTDLSGQGNNGTFVGTPTVVTGHDGLNALSFVQGVYLNVPDSTTLQFPGDFSVAAWMKSGQAQTSTDSPTIVSKYVHAGSGPTTNGYQILVNYASPGPDTWQFAVSATGTIGTSVPGTSANMADGSWHCLVGVRSGSTYLAYQDGVLANTITGGSTATIAALANPLIIGSTGSSDQFYIGALQYVQIYNLALTPAAIATYCAAQPPPPPPAGGFFLGFH